MAIEAQTKRVPVEQQAAQVLETVTNYVFYIPLGALMPVSFWSTARSDGGDIRVTQADGTTEVPIDLIDFDSVGETGSLFFKDDSDSVADKTYYIYYGDAAATGYADTDTYGKYNVWSSGFDYVWHLNEDPSTAGADGMKNSVENAHHGTPAGGGLTQTSVTKFEHKAMEFTGSPNNDRVLCGPLASTTMQYPMTWIVHLVYNDLSGQEIILARWNDGDSKYIFYKDIAGFRLYDEGGQTEMHVNPAFDALDVGAWDMISLASAADRTSKARGFLDVKSDTGTRPVATAAISDFSIGASHTGTASLQYDGDIQTVLWANTEWSDNYLDTWYNNIDTPASFWTVSAEEDAPGGGGGEDFLMLLGVS